MTTTTGTMSATRATPVRPEFDPQTGCHRVDHDADSPWEASTTLVLSLSTVTGEDPTAMVPLDRAVDPEVLNRHVRGRDRGATLTFEFDGHRVSVRDDGRIEFSAIEA